MRSAAHHQGQTEPGPSFNLRSARLFSLLCFVVFLALAYYGLWVGEIAIGGVIGSLRIRRSFLRMEGAAILAWLVPLFAQELLGRKIIAAATVISELAALGSSPLVPLALTAILGGLFPAVGYFFGLALRHFFSSVTEGATASRNRRRQTSAHQRAIRSPERPRSD